MKNMNQKECISVKFSEGLDIFDDYYGYPVIDKEEKYKGWPTGKVVDKQGPQAHAGRDFFVPEGKEFSFEIDECPYLHIAIKAEKETKTCLLLMVHDKEPDQHKNRFVVIGKTHNGDPGIYDVIEEEDRLTIKDDGKWHDEYCFDLRKIRNKFQNAGSISIIEFYSWIGSAEHSFHFIDLICKSDTTPSPIKSITVSPTLAKEDEKITVTVEAERGGSAHFSIAQVTGAAEVDMKENPNEPGTYSGHYVPKKGDDVKNAAVTVVFTSRSGETVSQIADQTVTIDTTPPKILEYSVEGKVASCSRAGVGGLWIEIVDKNVGGIVDKNVGGDVHLAEAVTDDDGGYLATFKLDALRQRGKQRLDLQARVFTGEIFLGASDVRYNASNRETLNILLTEEADSSLPSEHETLTGALFTHFQGNLRDLKETDDMQDITYLANKTGWDARAVALAALADQFSAKTADAIGAPKIEPVFFYALFRAGLPANENTLYHTDAKTLESVWKTAAEQGVIPKSSVNQIPNVIERFQVLSAQKILTGPALVGASSINEMLKVSRLDEQQQAKFAELYAANRADMSAFWKAIDKDKIFGATQDERDKTVTRLKVDGKLGFLTINNAPLMQKIHENAGDNGLSDPLQLAQMGYHRPEPWSRLLIQNKDIPIPNEIPGDTLELKRTNFAEYLGAYVRLSYPTASVAHLVKSRELQLTGAAPDASDRVHAFLTEHQGNFEISMHPIQQYIKDKKLTDADVSPEIVKQVMRLQRVQQITPSDQAMIGLMKHGIDAAYHVVRYDKETFVQNFAVDLGGADHAVLTYDNSVQIHNAVLNITLSYLTARTAPAIGVHSPAGILDPAPANVGDVIAYATLESLFGSMDFCACDHCRSILSPAAYLVDLLQFLYPDDKVWKTTLSDWKANHKNASYPFEDANKAKDFQNDWKANHENAPYPFKNQLDWNDFLNEWRQKYPGEPDPDPEMRLKPGDVLLNRRPDIQHLPLTCENTNIALPYIDIINETLEYFIANSTQKLSLSGYTGHDTNGIASEDLLASPQFVIDSAYKTLRSERFPALLPFHQPLENLRRYFNKFEVQLPLAMEQLRKNDNLERGTNPYGWRDILMEEIGLSRDEYEILTTSTATPNEVLWQIYGYPAGTKDADIINGNQAANIVALSNAKQFCRRVGITYEDLISVLKTRFINPNSYLIPKLERLGVSLATLDAIHKTPQGITDDDFNKLLPTGAAAIDVTEFGGNLADWQNNNRNYAPIIRTWLNNNNNDIYARIMQIITLTDPTASSDLCKFDNLEFRYSKPMTGAGDISTRLGAVEFVRLLRFIRLWKKLGWTIEQTDASITALYPVDPPGTTDMEKLDNGFLTLLPRLGIIVRIMKALNLTPKRDLLPLLSCFALIDTRDGAEWFVDKDRSRRLRAIPSLYRQLFLNPAMLTQDVAFADNGYGEYLHDNKEKLLAHAEALRSAFNLTGDEFDRIINALGFNTVVDVPYAHPKPSLEQSILDAGPGIGYDNQHKKLSYTGFLSATTRDALKSVAGVTADFKTAVDALHKVNQAALRPLTLKDISAIFRRGWLARKLKLSVHELLLLMQLTGLDPFAAPDPTNPAILRLIELVQAMKDRSFKSAAALYLIWNQDLSGKSAPDAAQLAALARTLRLGFAAVETEFAVADDPDGAIARTRMALVYGNDATNLFFSFLDNTFVTDVQYSRAAIVFVTKIAYTHNNATLEQTILDAASNQIAYDNTTKTLSFTGTLTDTVRDALKKIAGVTDYFKNAVDALYNENQEVVQANLEQPIVDIVPGRIYYDDFRKRLYFSGILTDDILKTLMNVKINGASLSQDFKDALQNLYQENKNVVEPFFARYTELLPLHDVYIFFGELKNTVPYVHAQNSLDQAILDVAPGRIAYNHARSEISFKGVLTASTLDALKAVAGVTAQFKAAVDNLFAANQAAIQGFFARYPTLAPQQAAYLAANDIVGQRRSVLLANFLPELKRRRKRQQVLQAVSAAANIDIAFVRTLLDASVVPFPLHAAGHTDQPASNDLLALERQGLLVQFFASDTATGAIIPAPDIASNLDYTPAVGGAGNPLPANPIPGAAISGVWRGYLEAPESGFFNFRIEADAGATVTLILDDKPVTLTQNATLWNNMDPMELRAGTLYFIKLTVEKVRNVVRVGWDWQPKGQGRAVIAARYLYPAVSFEAFKEAYIHFLKAASLATGLGLTANEIAYFATHADYRINSQGQIDSNGQGWLNILPNADNLHLTNPVDAAVAKNLNATLLTPLRALLDFARIKAEISPSDESLLTVLKDPVKETQKLDSLLFTITRWNKASLNDVLAQLSGNIAGLGHFDLFRRVYDAFALIQKMGISAEALIQATTNEPTAKTVHDLQAALRARYDAASWRDVVRPINDEMRSLQRDALVAYILHQMRSHPESAHIDTPDKLFEYFLMDVQMDPCMQTSRIRHALSSVQLFIERCLMNLEPRVSPAVINAKQWEWMKRYRVWEANRKVYLFPENWLEPELRDDKSPFFKEIESELLQSDITEERAATALLNYLSKLEEVAKLEPCGIYHIPAEPNKKEIDHVIARTAGAPRKYYYRRCYERRYWTPWEQIKLDIEDNPIIPVVWKDRLLLFWLRILKQPSVNPDSLSTEPGAKGKSGEESLEESLANNRLSDIKTSARKDAKTNTKMTVQAVLCWSEYYNGKWQATKTSDIQRPVEIGSFDPQGSLAFDRSQLTLSVWERDDTLLVDVDYPCYVPKNFKLYNTHSLPVPSSEDISISGKTRRLGTLSDPLPGQRIPFTIYYYKQGLYTTPLERPVLTDPIRPHTVQPRHPLTNIWGAPFFFEDSSNFFFVKTIENCVPIRDHAGYGVAVNPGIVPKKHPPLVVRRPRPIPEKFWGDRGPIGPDLGVIDQAPMQRFVTEDAYINKGIGTTGGVKYGDLQIGPSGAIRNLRSMK